MQSVANIIVLRKFEIGEKLLVHDPMVAFSAATGFKICLLSLCFVA